MTSQPKKCCKQQKLLKGTTTIMIGFRKPVFISQVCFGNYSRSLYRIVLQRGQNLVQVLKFCKIPTIFRCFTRVVKWYVETNVWSMRNILREKNKLFTKFKKTTFLTTSDIENKVFTLSEHNEVILFSENHFLVIIL